MRADCLKVTDVWEDALAGRRSFFSDDSRGAEFSATRGSHLAVAGGSGNSVPTPRAFRANDASIAGDALLALGILLATASQLRLGNLPIGPGELCLVIWLILMLVRELNRLGPPLTPALLRLLLFWTVFAFSLSLGFLTALFIGQQYDPRWVLHDVMAYPLLVAVSCLSVVDPGAKLRLRRVSWLLITFGTASLALQVAAGWKLIDIPLIQPWFWERFRGWSSNPNQLSLLCAVLALISLHLAETATRPSGRIVAIACSILPIYVGRMTESDTFTLALVASGPIFIVLKLRAWLSERRNVIHFAFAWIIALGLPLMLASLVPFTVVAAMDAGSLVKELSKNGGKDLGQESDLRFTLWENAMQLGMDSGMLGLGPGPHLEIPASILRARENTEDQLENIEHPQQSSAPNFEAHNTFLDLLTQGGMIAVLSFVWILGVSVFIAYKARLAGLAALICGLSIYCMTGLIIRHPMFWFSIALCLVAEGGPQRIVAKEKARGFLS
jgi:O-antigen ligase